MPELGALGGLPTEIILKVFKYLDGRDLARCLRVCKTLKHHIGQSSVTRYAIQLTQHGYKDGPHAAGDSPFSSTASRLKTLEDHINRWRSLDWSEEQIRLPQEQLLYNELVGRILAFSHGKSITCIELPSRICQTPLRTWTHQNDFKIYSFTIDPSQDLLVLQERLDSNGTMTLGIHLRTLSGNIQHPRACGMLSAPYRPHTVAMPNNSHLGVMGDAIALLDNDDGKLFIWNWWTGEPICVEKLQANVMGVLWIGPRTILLPWYSYEGSVCDALVLYEIGQDTHLRKIVALELPLYHAPMRREFFLYHVRVNQMPSGTVPFDSSDLRNIHFHIYAPYDHFAENAPELVVSVAALKQYADKYLDQDDLESTPSILWTDWGPHNTCLIFLSPRDKPWLCEVRGSRLAWLDTSKTLSVLHLTLNLPIVPSDVSQSQLPTLAGIRETESHNRSGPAIIYESPIHSEGVSLPYHQVKRRLEPSLSGPSRIFIDDEHILVFGTDDRGPVLIVLTL